MKPTRRVIYKICADKRRGVYFFHAVANSLRSARRKAKICGFGDVWVGQITKSKTRDVTKKVMAY